MVQIKICGITNIEDAQAAAEAGADALGFVFHPASPRCVTPAQAQAIIGSLPPVLGTARGYVHLPAAAAWGGWESGMVRHIPDPPPAEPPDPHTKLAIARFENWYIVNKMFFPNDNYILDNAARIAHLPCRMIHGRYDVICPATNAWELAQVLPQAKLTFIQDGGHAARDPGMTDAIVAALDEFRSLD